jgi:hypothetical protein
MNIWRVKVYSKPMMIEKPQGTPVPWGFSARKNQNNQKKL